MEDSCRKRQELGLRAERALNRAVKAWAFSEDTANHPRGLVHWKCPERRGFRDNLVSRCTEQSAMW